MMQSYIFLSTLLILVVWDYFKETGLCYKLKNKTGNGTKEKVAATWSSPPVQLCLQLAICSVRHDVLLPAALCGDAADVQHEVRPFHSGAVWGPQGAARLP